jgi:hypothetical protein
LGKTEEVMIYFFLGIQCLLILFIALHDWVNIPPLTNLSALKKTTHLNYILAFPFIGCAMGNGACKKILKNLIAILLLFPLLAFGQSPFDYDLHLFSIPGTSQRVMICFHGYGDNYEIAVSLKNLKGIEATLVSFNFPEYDIKQGRKYDYTKATFGTFDELLPALYVMKQVVLDQGRDSIDLYGFSAGGGALINVIGVLNTSIYDDKLKEVGIGTLEKEKLLTAIQRGLVILDTPLKSIEEIINFRGSTDELECLAKNYRDNHLRPIDSLRRLRGLSLDILLHFQGKDEILSNRDDDLYIERLKATQSKIEIIIEDDGGHMSPHLSLWRLYFKKMYDYY